MSVHNYYLNRCFELALIAENEGESAVGSVLVLNGAIIGEGYEQSRQRNDVTRHAEVVAILNAIANNHDCKGAILYSNVEPCILCSYVIRHYQIATVVFSKLCGELGGTNSRFNILTTDVISLWTDAPEIILLKRDESF
ncbi:nucleoside deaminase [Pedobacter aquatilis]|uniref:nucleoside deaminase n=1 Tax=Pedobacter aquatilis TaxID=351343 RepID=UPI00292E33F7|nr:deaminase [Pedobacter aquatilis]